MNEPKGKPTFISGIVDIITYVSDDGTYAIIKVKPDLEYKSHPAVNSHGHVAITGSLTCVTVGEQIEVNGELTRNKYGLSIKADSFKLLKPKSLYDIERYLYKTIKFIGPEIARLIVRKFGNDTFDVIDNSPNRLLEIDLIGAGRLEEIKKVWKQYEGTRKTLVFATSVGVSGKTLDSIVKFYGDKAIDVIKSNPYDLAFNIKGLGFKKCDEIAKKMGLPELSENRMIASLRHGVLEGESNKGDCFQYANELIQTVFEFLSDTKGITNDFLRYCLIQAVQKGVLSADGDKIYNPITLEYEIRSAQQLAAIIDAPMPVKVDDEAIEYAYKSMGINLSDQQKLGIRTALTNKISVLTGSPGSGKTTVSKAIVEGFDHLGMSVTLLSPTGRAAKRLKETTGRSASTIHKWLFSQDETRDGVFIVDEFSMCDLPLMYQFIGAISHESIVVFVGDKDQLPSVGHGSILRDLIACGRIPTTHLKQVFRQAAGSEIAFAASEINEGRMPNFVMLGRNKPAIKSDLYLVSLEDATDQANAALWCATTMAQQLGFDPKTECQVLSPMKRGDAGVLNLNKLLQISLNPNPKDSVVRFGGEEVWSVGDKVIQKKNMVNGLVNGDIGVITEMTKDKGSLESITVKFDDMTYRFTSEDWGNLKLSFASTIHSFQGSECKMVVMLLDTSHFMLLQRNMLYTGLTRGKKQVVLIAHPQALQRAIQNNQVARRNSHLADRIVNALEEIKTHERKPHSEAEVYHIAA